MNEPDGSAMAGHSPIARPRGNPNRAALRARTAAAVGHWEAGRPDDALALLAETAESSTEALGVDDPDAVVARGNLAAVRASRGHWGLALPALVANVADRERLFGSDHPATLCAQDALATAFRETGALLDALRLSMHVSARRQRVLGSAHPDTLTTRTGHGLTLAELGDHHGATTVLAAALRDAERGTRSDAVPLAVTRGHLARALAARGEFAAAAVEADRAARACAEHLGPRHADTVALSDDAAEFAQRVPRPGAETGSLPAGTPQAGTPQAGFPQAGFPLRSAGPAVVPATPAVGPGPVGSQPVAPGPSHPPQQRPA